MFLTFLTPKPAAILLCILCLFVPPRRSYDLKGFSALSDFVCAPPAGRRRLAEEVWRFHRTEQLIAAAGGAGDSFAGGHLELHYQRVDKAGGNGKLGSGERRWLKERSCEF